MKSSVLVAIFINIVICLFSCTRKGTTTVQPKQKGEKFSSNDTLTTMDLTRADGLIHFISLKRSFQYGSLFSDKDIRQEITNLSLGKSKTSPEIPKVFMIIGVLYQDLGNVEKAQEYFRLEITLANAAIKIPMEETYKDNWRRSKIESLHLLKDTNGLHQYHDLIYKPKYFEHEEWFNLSYDQVYSSYSLRKRVHPDYSIFVK